MIMEPTNSNSRPGASACDREEVLKQHHQRLLRLCGKAAKALEASLHADSEYVALKAAKFALENASDWVDYGSQNEGDQVVIYRRDRDKPVFCRPPSQNGTKPESEHD